MTNNIKDYIFNKLFFPKVVTIDKPGIIYNIFSRKFGGRQTKRVVLYFEDIIANLQLETVEVLGKQSTNDLWYKIGKDVGARYMLLGKSKKPPSYLLPIIIDYLLTGFSSTGFSITQKQKFNHKKRLLILKGYNNIICRKSEISDYFAGAISGLLSNLYGKNIEAEMRGCCNSNKSCKIVMSPNIKTKYIPDINEIKPSKSYNQLNFSYKERKYLFKKTSSYSDLIKFKKIMLEPTMNFQNKTISVIEIGCLELIQYNYKKIGQEKLFIKGVTKGAEKLANELFIGIDNKFKFIESMISGFGFGIPYYKKSKKEIEFNFIHAPITKFGFWYQVYVLNGFLNHYFDCKVHFKKIDINKDYSRIKVNYLYS